MKRQVAYTANGISLELLTELMSEIRMYDLLIQDAENLGEFIADSHPLMIKKYEKQDQLNGLLRLKYGIKQQFPIN